MTTLVQYIHILRHSSIGVFIIETPLVPKGCQFFFVAIWGLISMLVIACVCIRYHVSHSGNEANC